ncbi:hypothetical protein P8825_14985 [Shouchella clausii]|uniref:hypothetical protein n=1 Tax=Shouchella clausii TaxID=79880 RepID=UPI002DBA21D7|nr:hypothetical protein [Shouchella clausii]MEB5480869.1 hypothetical protein [Shouchella clausii]
MKLPVENESIKLRKMYDSGFISAEEFVKKLFASDEADRKRRDIVKTVEKFRK